jgi:hypothetical protein
MGELEYYLFIFSVKTLQTKICGHYFYDIINIFNNVLFKFYFTFLFIYICCDQIRIFLSSRRKVWRGRWVHLDVSFPKCWLPILEEKEAVSVHVFLLRIS